MKWSFISIATLLCEPPAMNQTPSVAFSDVARSTAVLMLSGIAMPEGWFTCTLPTPKSINVMAPWVWVMRSGNCTAPWLR
jgi:hypothetical protein